MSNILSADHSGKFSVLENISIPESIQSNWQNTVDLLADIFDVPSSLIMRVHKTDIEVLISSKSEGNIFTKNDRCDLNNNLFCEKAIESGQIKLEPDATNSSEWIGSPIIDLGMISYLGVPLFWPNKEVFGTICVLDKKENHFNEKFIKLIVEFQKSVQLSLKNIYENQLLKQEKIKAERANQAKSIFLANMSHELRTPLNAIIGFSNALQEEKLTDESKEGLHAINFSGEHLLQLINDVLDMSKIEAGKMHYNESHFELIDTLTSICQIIDKKANDKGLSFSKNLAENLPHLIQTDLIKLRQILINILTNAIKYTNQGHVSLRVWSEIQTNEQTTLFFEIKDTGIGISDQQQKEIFKPFQQINSHNIEGTGLGLAISAKFIELMNGDISITSQPNLGSTFIVSLPCKTSQDAIEKNNVNSKIIGLVDKQKIIKVLVAEDDQLNLTLLKKILCKVGFQVRTANNGEQAIEVTKSYQPDFIWLNSRLAKIDGIDSCKQILKLNHQRTPVIAALTTNFDNDEYKQLTAAGFRDVILKPYQADTLLETMAQHLDIEFQYHNTDTNQDELSQARLYSEVQHLDKGLLTELHQALEMLDGERVLELLSQLPMQHANLVAQLTELTKAFEFEQLIDLVSRPAASSNTH